MNKATLGSMLLILAACDGGGGSAPQNVTSIKIATPYADKLRSLSQQNRDLALRRAVQDAGETCKRITSSNEGGTYKNMTIWNAYCEGGKDYAIFIAPNGDVQVRGCGDVAELGLPACSKAAE